MNINVYYPWSLHWKTIFELVLIKTDDFIFLLLFLLLLLFVNVRHVSIEAMGIQAFSDINGKYTISWNTNIFDICLETYWTARLWNWAPLAVINWWHICCPFEGMAFHALGFDKDYHFHLLLDAISYVGCFKLNLILISHLHINFFTLWCQIWKISSSAVSILCEFNVYIFVVYITN